MKLAVGRVVDGRVVLEGDPSFEDGSPVTVLAQEGERTFTLDAEAEARLLEAMAEADRGDLIDAEDILRLIPPEA